jgi:hypothetical protein
LSWCRADTLDTGRHEIIRRHDRPEGRPITMLMPRNSPAAVAAAALIFGLAGAPSGLHAADESEPAAASPSAAAEDASGATEEASNTEDTDRAAIEGYGGAESGVDGVYGFNDKKLRERGRRAFGMH